MSKEKSLEYHKNFPSGKLSITVTKPMNTAQDLSVAYSPFVAEPCLEIEKNPEDAYIYTSKSNLVAVMSNGTAVLGLGDIGALASKPVMEGKAALFKKFSGVDSFDLEIDEKDPKKFIAIAKALSPTFGGINLEDIKAPECFEIEETLIRELDIPVFHDDQHGTAIIAAAGVKSACKIQNKNLSDCKIIVSGAGAGAIATLNMLQLIGAKVENCFVYDSKGLITKDRVDLNKYKKAYAQNTKNISLEDALDGADIFLGLSKGNLLTPDMVKQMAEHPIIFALANPTPEIFPDEAKKACPTAIVATGRSDFPNQVNNVLCFPFLFRGALDVSAKEINASMKIACVDALSELAEEPVPEEIETLYGRKLSFGPDYIIPTPFDPRLCKKIAKAVAKAAIDSGVARNIIDMASYDALIEKRLNI